MNLIAFNFRVRVKAFLRFKEGLRAMAAAAATTTTAAVAAQAEQSNAKPGLRKPVFTKVDQLKPGTSGHTLVVMVLTSNTVLQKGRSVSQHLRQTRIAECLVGDQTGTILFTARNDQGIVFLFALRSLYFYLFILKLGLGF